MTVPLPNPRLWAEADSFPFWSRKASSLQLVAVRRTPDHLLDSATLSLAEAFVEHLRPQGGGRSLRDLEHLRDARWFGSNGTGVALDRLARQIAVRYLESGGGKLRLRSWAPASEVESARMSSEPPDGEIGHARRTEAWRWITLYLPADWLVAAASVEIGSSVVDGSVELCPPALRQLLERGVAETHVHAGAALGFDLLWSGLMSSAHRNLPGESLELEACAIARCVLVLALLPSPSGERRSLGAVETILRRALVDSPTGPALAAELMRVCARLAAGGTEWDRPRLAWLFNRCLARRGRVDISLDGVLSLDPIAGVAPAGHGDPERWLHEHALRYIETGSAGEDFERLYWQYVRVRNRFYHWLVCRPGTSGLQWFQRFYSRISPAKTHFEPHLVEAASLLQRRTLRLDSLEVRMSPRDKWHVVRDLVRGVAAQSLRLAKVCSDRRCTRPRWSSTF
jgi:hypothetical protein